MKNLVSSLIVLVLALVFVELTSSYFFYRYYAHARKTFQPLGSAALELTEHSFEWLKGDHRQVQVSVDHGPVFQTSDLLGFTLSPGQHRITELYAGHNHVFDLAVTSQNLRASSYFPVHSSKRLIVTGDSSIFGWGVDDQETVPWLLQARLPDFEVVNLSLNSYSTVHALLQLQQLVPALGPDDIVVLGYHPDTNFFNVAAPSMLRQLSVGYEVQAGDSKQLHNMDLPFGALDASGNLTIHRIRLSCVYTPAATGCAHPAVSEAAAQEVTKRAFDAIIALHPGHLVVAFLSGADDDPVISYLRQKGLAISDFRPKDGYPEDDLIPTDLHAGPFWHHQHYVLLLGTLQHEHLVE